MGQDPDWASAGPTPQGGAPCGPVPPAPAPACGGRLRKFRCFARSVPHDADLHHTPVLQPAPPCSSPTESLLQRWRNCSYKPFILSISAEL